MEDFYIYIAKPIALGIISVVVSILLPLQDVLYVLGSGFLINIFTGIVTDIHVNEKEFDIKKAFNAISQLMFYFVLIYYVHSSFVRLKHPDWAEKATIWITFVVSYYYLVNILRNATKAFPTNDAIKLMYMILTTKVFSLMKRYFNLNKDNNDKDRVAPSRHKK